MESNTPANRNKISKFISFVKQPLNLLPVIQILWKRPWTNSGLNRMMEIIKLLAAMVIGTISIQSLVLAYRLWLGDSSAYEQNRLRTGSWRQSALGRVPTDFDGRRDYKVAAGIALDTSTNSWVEQGRLSAEAIAATLKS
jgi:hypothetical protein